MQSGREFFHQGRGSSLQIRMPKRKRKDSESGVEGSQELKSAKEKKSRDVSASGKRASKMSSFSHQSSELTAPENATEISKPKAVRIIVGSYEKVLCGIDARFDDQSKNKVVVRSQAIDAVAHPKFDSSIHVLCPYRIHQNSCCK